MFIALTPDEPFHGRLKSLKALVRSIAGEQQYLADPPHLTLYVGAFREAGPVIAALDGIAQGDSPVEIDLAGWHVFLGDPLTGRSTIVCDPAPSCVSRLRALQGRVVDAVSPLRDPEASARRYRFALASLSPEEAASVARYGYPFVGEIWRPHLTVASVAPGDWNAVWAALEPEAPHGSIRCSRMTLYSLAGEVPAVVRQFVL
jgi:2'-5' RNA ligase